MAWALVIASLGAGCEEASPPLEDPPVTAPSIPWLATGEPEIAEPVIPWLEGDDGDPVTRACAPGWTRRESEAGAICDPWPEGGRPRCEGATAIRPGETACMPIGRACPASGDLPTDVPGDAIFVRAGAAGTGTRESPFGTLSEALASASAGDTIVLATGTIDAVATVSVPVTIRGTCAAETRLTGPLAIDGPVTLEDVTITSPTSAIVVSRGGLTARGVVVGDHVGRGIDLRSGINTLEDVVVRGGTGATATFEGAVHVINGSLTATRLVIEGRAGFGLTVDLRASLTLTDSLVADGTTSDTGPTAMVLLRDGSMRASVTRTVVENGVNQMIAANGGDVTIEDTLVQGARIQPGQMVAIGVTGFGGLVARGLRTHDIDGFGIASAGGRVEVEDYVSDGTHALSVGLHSEEGSTMIARRVRVGPIAIGARAFVRGVLELDDARVTGATQYSLQANGEEAIGTFRRVLVRGGRAGLRVGADATAEIEDAILEDIAGSGIGDDGIGGYLRSRTIARRVRATRTANSCFASLQEASLELEDVRCSGADLGLVTAVSGSMIVRRASIDTIALAALVAESGGALTAEDTVVRAVGPSENISAGVSINDGSSATLTRVRLAELDGYGGACSDGDEPPRLGLTDVVIQDATLGGLSTDCLVSLERVEILRAGVAGISHTTPTTVFEVRDVRVIGTVPDPVDGRFGHGIHLVAGGAMRGSRVVVEDARGAGVLVTGVGTTLELTDLWVSGVRAAVCGAGCTGGGSGIVATDGAIVRLTNVRSFEHEVAGVQLVSPATMELHGGWIHHDAIGRNLSPGLDATPLLDGVIYVSNGVEEDRRALALPAVTLF